MGAATGISATLADANAWTSARRSPFVVVVAGVDASGIVDAALADTALTAVAMPRFEPACTPPCDALLWRLETGSGDSLNRAGLIARHWHRQPYAMTVRLVQYQPGSVEPEILDEGTLGTRGAYAAFAAAVDRLTMRFVRDAALGRGRGPATALPAAPPSGLPGWLDAFLAKWHNRLMAEWWSIGSSVAPPDLVLSGRGLGKVTWHRTKAGSRYLADPFPWPGTGRILCEEMPISDGVGRIVAVSEQDGALLPPTVLLDDGDHHSYPCTVLDDDGAVYCVPESTRRGTTFIHRLDAAGRLSPVCAIAPHARLADPTLFRWNDRYWIGCTDLDLGSHDNLCLLHAPAITGPWASHARWPVKIDVRAARPAGMIFNFHGRLFRPGQDCAATYGAAVAIHQIEALSETEFRESLVGELRPDKSGPFPHGLHTLVHDGDRFWIDGKRYVFDLGLLKRKLFRRASGLFATTEMD
jgi:hypothetical protein